MKVVCFDLDDTLYKEIDYLKSAYREIASYAADYCRSCSDSPIILSVKAYDAMFLAYKEGLNAFERLNAFLGINLPVSEYLQIYRKHKPNIRLSETVESVLNSLKSSECIIGLITDGRSIQQRNKIEALGLNRWIRDEDVLISGEFGSEKPAPANYEYFMKRYPECDEFMYVGDNLKKDFIAPNALGWQTVCLKDDGRNIHKQDFSSISSKAMPRVIIEDLNRWFSKNDYLMEIK